MTNLVVDQDNLTQVVRDWLNAQGVPTNEKIELVFLEGEMIVRPQSARHAELDRWFEEAARKYESVFRRLADS